MVTFVSATDKNLNSGYNRQQNNYYATNTMGANNCINSLNLNLYKKEFGNLCLMVNTAVPESHKRVADSYVLVRRVFGTPVVHSGLTAEEKRMLIRFDFYPLEYTNAKQMEQEIEFLKKWSNEKDKDLREATDKIIQIRGKELKHTIANNYREINRDIYDGYKVLDRYFQEISKYNRKS